MQSKYTEAGVDIDKGNQIVKNIKTAVRSTFNKNVMTDIGLFGGLYDGSSFPEKSPILVSSIDGVGTKLHIAAELKRFKGVGHDIVAHCCDDILVQGARPLFFLDYVAASDMEATAVVDIVTGMAEECSINKCALIGGETAEMPGSYMPGQYDIVGCIVGVVDRNKVIDGHTIAPGDVAIGLASSGLHTNGYSLARKVLLKDAALDLNEIPKGCSATLGDILLEPHRSYVPVIQDIMSQITIKGMAHITGGGFLENIPRILPANTAIKVDVKAAPVPPIYKLIQELGKISANEMYRVFNMGIGMFVIVDKQHAEVVLSAARARALPAFLMGEITPGLKEVTLENL